MIQKAGAKVAVIAGVSPASDHGVGRAPSPANYRYVKCN